MPENMQSAIDYEGLIELAKSREITVVEMEDLEGKCGIRFEKNGKKWIAIAAGQPVSEKIRALGFLLENYPGWTAGEDTYLSSLIEPDCAHNY
ncbi:MAG: hypothetical protein ABFD98_06355 [Syntrophobacteraceae bacterium]|nr:hypothetical protein [Desulfobacteraceae bacterium]